MSVFKFSKTYELSLSRDYCARWGLVEAIRELLQNALDSESPFEYSFGPDKLSIMSRFATLEPATLLLGRTSKSDNPDAIGSFGEGYKIALLVLTRLGHPLRVLNGNRLWTAEFRRSNSFDGETLHIIDAAAPEKNEGLTFEIGGLTAGDIEAIRASCLHMQSDIGESHSTKYGRILRGRPGKLYVGGLFICDTTMKFGYDIKPEYIQLERDRQTVSSFDLAFRAGDMWKETGLFEEVAQMVEDGIPDLEYVHYSSPDILKEECYKLFKKKHPTGIVAKTREELRKAVEEGLTQYVYCGDAYGAMVSSAPSYKASMPVQLPTPLAHLERYFASHRQHMRTPAIVAFKELLHKAEGWKL